MINASLRLLPKTCLINENGFLIDDALHKRKEGAYVTFPHQQITQTSQIKKMFGVSCHKVFAMLLRSKKWSKVCHWILMPLFWQTALYILQAKELD